MPPIFWPPSYSQLISLTGTVMSVILHLISPSASGVITTNSHEMEGLSSVSVRKYYSRFEGRARRPGFLAGCIIGLQAIWKRMRNRSCVVWLSGGCTLYLNQVTLVSISSRTANGITEGCVYHPHLRQDSQVTAVSVWTRSWSLYIGDYMSNFPPGLWQGKKFITNHLAHF